MVGGLKPWLWLPPKWSYYLAHQCLPTLARLASAEDVRWSERRWRQLQFRTPLGLAGGVDKDATQVLAWWRLGAGFIEVGTVTPKPQPGHSGKVIDRVVAKKAVWNRLGFPGKGALALRAELESLPRPYQTPIFVNIGKNATTELKDAHLDYLACIDSLFEGADAFVVNVSSPNTSGLRELLKPERFKDFIGPIKQAAEQKQRPLLVKISPDLEREDLHVLLKVGRELSIDGWVLTNTSLGLREGLPFPKEGGVSGEPLSELSKRVLSWAIEELGPPRSDRPLLVSAGGVLNSSDVTDRIEMGADLVQVYSALIFEGPFFFRQVARTLSDPHRAARPA